MIYDAKLQQILVLEKQTTITLSRYYIYPIQGEDIAIIHLLSLPKSSIREREERSLPHYQRIDLTRLAKERKGSIIQLG